MVQLDTYHAYVYGTAFWYFLRGIMRLINPWAVISWFRPPVDSLLVANDLELYTIRTDAFGLLTLAALLIVMSDAVPLPGSLIGSTFVPTGSEKGKKPYAKAMIALTIFHHVATGVGSWQHWRVESHRTVAMDIGVWGNLGLTLLGLVTLGWGMGEGEGRKVAGTTPRKAR